MRVRELVSILNQQSPESSACSWDNPGLQVGDFDWEVSKVYLALDAEDDVIRHAVESGADFLLTHHPLIFHGIKKINSDDFIGRRILMMAQNHLAYYAMHTNFDIHGMADFAAQKMDLKNPKVLEVEFIQDGNEEGIGRIGTLASAVTLKECIDLVKKAYDIEQVKVFGNLSDKIQRVAISPGSGKSVIPAALEKQAEVLITGDIDHHTGIDAIAQNMAVIDAGHYGIEHIFIEYMEGFLKQQCPELALASEPHRAPFQIL